MRNGEAMGSFADESFSLSQQATAPVVQERLHTKSVLDNVHDTIYLDPLSLRFIDTEQFQRLREIKQLGVCNYVYPGAVHSRFEHSLGVYWLAGDAINRLNRFQGEELGIEKIDIAAVKLAGLLHDVGHGPFSHVFDGDFIPKVFPGMEWSHEQMSVKMIDYIVDEHCIDNNNDCLKKVKDLILGSCNNTYETISSGKTFLYDIVANGRNNIDVDKFDYIERDSRACGLRSNVQWKRLMENMRVVDDEICYRDKEYWNVHKLFDMRADLFRRVYLHSKVMAVQHMVVDALVLANPYLQISSQISDPSEYWKLDDSILRTIETAHDEELKEAQALILRMRRRDLYQFINQYSVPYENLEHFREVTAKDIVCAQVSSGVNLKEEDVAVSNIKIDLSQGLENPMDRVHFFQDYESNVKFHIERQQISHLLPQHCQDRIVRVYAKNPNLVDEIAKAFENFQQKTYGRMQQVQGTPKSKRRRISEY